MSIIDAIMMGLIQGLSEFLPISSSGHLFLYEKLFEVQVEANAMMLLTVLFHVGTLVAVVVVFWHDWMDILKNLFRSKMLLFLFLASLPALAAKVLFDDLFETLNTGSFLAIYFIFTALLLCAIEWISKKQTNALDKNEDLKLKNVMAMGGMQALGIFSGVSRSGTTIFGGIASGLPRYMAAKFSFMMSAPAIVGGLLVEGKAAIEAGAMTYFSANAMPVIVGMVVAGVSGYLTVRYMLKLINKISFYWFALYLGIIAVVTLICQFNGVGAMPPFGV